MTPAGFPHSEILGSKPVCGSPGLIAAYRVLHRLSAPRHPPCTLSSLTKLEYSLSGESYRFLPDSVVKDQRGSLGSALEPQRSPTAHPRALSNKEPCRPIPSRPVPTPTPASPTLGGADRDRTDDLRLARAALSQLSYSPLVPHTTQSARR
jgi:hypothetical protein